MTPDSEVTQADVDWVRQVARRVKRKCPPADFDDLVGDGLVGLLDARRRFDPSKVRSESSWRVFAERRIAGEMLDGLRRWWPGGRDSMVSVIAVDEIWALDLSSDPADQLQDDTLTTLVDSLPLGERVAIREHVMGDASLAAVGDLLLVSESMVCKYVSSGLRRLRGMVAA